MATRKVPVHRGGGSSGSAARPASHPGVSGNAGAASAFQSPYQPPAGESDLRADVAALDPDAWHTVLVAGTAWRVKMPTPSALELLADMGNVKGNRRVYVVNGFLVAHMHPDDLSAMLLRMMDPDDDFSDKDYIELFRAAVTVGTARPFPQWFTSLALLRTAGDSYAPSSAWSASRRR